MRSAREASGKGFFAPKTEKTGFLLSEIAAFGTAWNCGRRLVTEKPAWGKAHRKDGRERQRMWLPPNSAEVPDLQPALLVVLDEIITFSVQCLLGFLFGVTQPQMS